LVDIFGQYGLFSPIMGGLSTDLVAAVFFSLFGLGVDYVISTRWRPHCFLVIQGRLIVAGMFGAREPPAATVYRMSVLRKSGRKLGLIGAALD
jgi:hypothetical protein